MAGWGTGGDRRTGGVSAGANGGDFLDDFLDDYPTGGRCFGDFRSEMTSLLVCERLLVGKKKKNVECENIGVKLWRMVGGEMLLL